MTILRQVAIWWAAVWLVLLAAQMLAIGTMPGGWSRNDYSMLTRTWFVSGEAVLAALTALVIAALCTGSTLAGRRLMTTRPALARVPAALLLLLISLFYFASWSLYAVLNEFIGLDAIRMLGANGLQLLEHAQVMAANQLVMVPLIALIATLTMLLLQWLIARIAPRGQQRILATLVMTLAAAAVFTALYGATLRGRVLPVQGKMITMEDVAFLRASQRSGPLTFLREDAIDALVRQAAPVSISEGYVSRPLVTPEAYQTRIGDEFRELNVVILVIESLRPDVFEIFDGDRTAMPLLESVAHESVRFHDAYAASSHSNYADIAIVSSQYPLRSRNTHYYPENSPYPKVMLQDVLAPLGYRSAMFSSQNEDWGGMINFIDSGGFETIVHAGNFQGELREEHVLYRNRAFEKYRREMNLKPRGGKLDDAVTIDLAREWLHQLDDDQPFYLHLNMQSSHLPYYVPPEFPRRFFTEQGEALDILREGRLIELTSAQMHAAYLDSLAYVDVQVARLIDDLKQSGRWENTVLVVTGDTATSFDTLVDYDGDGAMTKIIGNGGMLIEDAVRIPLFVRAPELPSRDVRQQVQHIDILPGVFHLLGLPAHPGLQGLNPFAPIPEQRPAFLVAQTPAATQFGAVLGDWKLIHDLDLGRHIFEYVGDGTATPEDPAVRQRVRYLQAELADWVQAQLAYYDQPELFDKFYPPVREWHKDRNRIASNATE
ncbi:MAG: sulfatase-like hydrolase/transferase [Proteobacteria bacterium]|nr:sulfatase-like hydrolase/transferase [Pseudomonadota bacterium]